MTARQPVTLTSHATLTSDLQPGTLTWVLFFLCLFLDAILLGVARLRKSLRLLTFGWVTFGWMTFGWVTLNWGGGWRREKVSESEGGVGGGDDEGVEAVRRRFCYKSGLGGSE